MKYSVPAATTKADYDDAVADVKNAVHKLERRARNAATEMLKAEYDKARAEGRKPAVDTEAIAREALKKALADMTATA
jgi:hypothetical protein